MDIRGEKKPVLIFMTGDWEAGAERFGGQGASSKNPSFVCTIAAEDLQKHSEKGQHNHKTVKCQIRSFDSLSENYQNQIRKLNFSSIEEFKENVDMTECNEYERVFRNNGKKNKSVIGDNISGVNSLDYYVGGDLHNQGRKF